MSGDDEAAARLEEFKRRAGVGQEEQSIRDAYLVVGGGEPPEWTQELEDARKLAQKRSWYRITQPFANGGKGKMVEGRG